MYYSQLYFESHYIDFIIIVYYLCLCNINTASLNQKSKTCRFDNSNNNNNILLCIYVSILLYSFRVIVLFLKFIPIKMHI